MRFKFFLVTLIGVALVYFADKLDNSWMFAMAGVILVILGVLGIIFWPKSYRRRWWDRFMME